MLSCREVCEQAQEYTDGQLGPLARARIKLHVLMCRNCTGFLDQTRKTSRLLRAALENEQDQQVTPDLMSAFRRNSSDKAAEQGASTPEQEKSK